MYIKPTTKKGMAFAVLLDSALYALPMMVIEFILIFPIVAERGTSLWPELYLLAVIVLALAASPFLVGALSILVGIKRYAFLKTNKELFSESTPPFHKALNILCFFNLWESVAIFTVAPILLFLDNILRSNTLASVLLLISTVISLPLLIAVFVLTLLQKRAMKLSDTMPEKPEYLCGANKKRAVALILAVALLIPLLIPIPLDRGAMYEGDRENRVFYRTDSALISYITVKNADTREKEDLKIVPFPLNLKETDEIFGIEK